MTVFPSKGYALLSLLAPRADYRKRDFSFKVKVVVGRCSFTMYDDVLPRSLLWRKFKKSKIKINNKQKQNILLGSHCRRLPINDDI